MDWDWITHNDYKTEALKMIDKMQNKIKEEEEKINDCNLNIHIYTNYLIEKIQGLYIDISSKTLEILWRGFHKDKKDETMSDEEKSKYKASYDFINYEIINAIICDTKCKYKKTKIINNIIIEGYEGYAYDIYFIANNIEFILTVPVVKNITPKNLPYSHYGMYGLAYKKSSCCTEYICRSYDMKDLAKAFKTFIEERENNNEIMA